MGELAAIPEYRAISRAEFFNELVPRQQPVVLKGLVADWPAVVQSRTMPGGILDYLHPLDSGAPLSICVGAPEIGGRFFYRADWQGLNFTRQQETFAAFCARLVQANWPGPALALQGAPLVQAFPGFRALNPFDFFDDEVQPRLWLGNRVHVAAHYDGSDNLACVLAGRRRFVLFPPAQVANLYPGPLDFTPAGAPVSLVDGRHPDLGRFPRYREALAQGMVAELEPGDAIFIPMLWWHQVDSLAEVNALVNYWWQGSIGRPAQKPSPVEVMGLAAMALRDLTPPQREAWRQLFNHYVFAQGDGPASYIPPSQLGILGDVSPELERQIKDWFIGLLSR